MHALYGLGSVTRANINIYTTVQNNTDQIRVAGDDGGEAADWLHVSALPSVGSYIL